MNSLAIKKNTILKCIMIIILYLLVFQEFLQEKIIFFKYFDEMLAILFIPTVIYYKFKNKNIAIKKNDFVIIIALIIIAILGFLANAIYKYQKWNAVFSDCLLVYKFFMVYYLSEIFFKNNKVDYCNKVITIHIKILVILFFILTVLNYIFDIWNGEIRYGIKTNMLFYSHPTVLVGIMVFLLSLHIRCEKRIITPYTILILIVIFTTLRSKAIGFEIVFIALAIYTKKSSKNISFTKLGIITLILIVVAWPQIKTYFIKLDDSARAMLLKNSFEIADDYFPTGSGFATYGSYYSGKIYSPIYSMYNMSNIYGLQEGKTYFLSDSFWPMILGQFGYIGTILYIIVILMIYKKINNGKEIEQKCIYLSKMIALSYLLIASTAEAAFVSPIAIPLAIILGV